MVVNEETTHSGNLLGAIDSETGEGRGEGGSLSLSVTLKLTKMTYHSACGGREAVVGDRGLGDKLGVVGDSDSEEVEVGVGVVC